MNTLLLSPELFRADGGIPRIMRIYLKALCGLCAEGDQVNSIVLNDRPGRDERLEKYGDAHLHEHIGCGRDKWLLLRQTLRLARRSDRLVCGHLHLLPLAMVARWLHPRLSYCLVAHGIEVWRPYTWIERRALHGAHRILCVSDYTRRQMQANDPKLDPTRMIVVPNALDPVIREFGVPSAVERKSSAPVILTVGRLALNEAGKGYDTLIRAMTGVLVQLPDARLRIVGGGEDRPRLQALAEQCGVAAAVDFPGFVSDEALSAEYAGCDLFALPSRKEGFGLVYLEAMSFGKPCVGVRAGGVPEVITPEVGRLVEFDDETALAATIVDLARRPPDSEIVRRHADSFAFPAFQARLGAALN
jgi:phosphatidylinositol alpha-1,6-mannosyltransferase